LDCIIATLGYDFQEGQGGLEFGDPSGQAEIAAFEERVVPENLIRGDSRDEAESAHHSL